MPTQAYNLLWLGLKLQSESPGVKAPFIKPIPDENIDNIKLVAEKNPEAEVRLWVDSKRHTKDQMEWIREMAEKSGHANLSIQDLRTVDEYDKNFLFNQSETAKNWRLNKHSLIWRQVDVAKLLVCLQGDHDQVFYSDTDHLIDSSSDDVQKILSEKGVVARRIQSNVENQAFGFTRNKKDFFRELYGLTLDSAFRDRNGYETFIYGLRKVTGGNEKIAIETEWNNSSVGYPEDFNQEFSDGFRK